MGFGLRPGAKAPDEPPSPTGYAPPLDSTAPMGRAPPSAEPPSGTTASRCSSPGTARLIEAGTTLVFEMHYTPTGEPHIHETRIGLVFTDTPPERQVWDGAITMGSS